MPKITLLTKDYLRKTMADAQKEISDLLAKVNDVESRLKTVKELLINLHETLALIVNAYHARDQMELERLVGQAELLILQVGEFNG